MAARFLYPVTWSAGRKMNKRWLVILSTIPGYCVSYGFIGSILLKVGARVWARLSSPVPELLSMLSVRYQAGSTWPRASSTR